MKMYSWKVAVQVPGTAYMTYVDAPDYIAAANKVVKGGRINGERGKITHDNITEVTRIKEVRATSTPAREPEMKP